ncbi:hypothetical protein OAO01_04705 [Oligoflexia bacterium]|nr:hypothetical protein [Oligoflexia bacterium]
MYSGYKNITVIQLVNGIAAWNEKLITFAQFKRYIALFEEIAKCEARERSIRAKTGRAYTVASPKMNLGKLARVGLVSRDGGGILVTETPLEFSYPLLNEISGQGRRRARKIPVPRKLLQELMQSRKPALVKVILAYLIRGLSFSKEGGVKTRGAIKASWISENFGLSLRAVKGARAELIERGFISRDIGSTQWKLNRDGAYFEIRLDSVTEEKRPQNAPPQGEKRPEFAPPYIRPKIPYGSKNQKLTGVKKQTEKKARVGELPPPNIWNVLEVDLSRISRVFELYKQAIRAQIISKSEANRLNFFAAAIRARDVEEGEPTRVFMALIKRQLWHHITNEQEDRARAAIVKSKGCKMAA